MCMGHDGKHNGKHGAARVTSVRHSLKFLRRPVCDCSFTHNVRTSRSIICRHTTLYRQMTRMVHLLPQSNRKLNKYNISSGYGFSSCLNSGAHPGPCRMGTGGRTSEEWSSHAVSARVNAQKPDVTIWSRYAHSFRTTMKPSFKDPAVSVPLYGVIRIGIHTFPHAFFGNFGFWMLLAKIKTFASFTIIIVRISAATDCRRCKNMCVPLQHKIYSLNPIYLPLIHKGNEWTAM
jgi:hypothetical protein